MKVVTALNLQNNKIENIAQPTSNNDAVNKVYVDTKISTKITISTSAPPSPSVNDIWIDIS